MSTARLPWRIQAVLVSAALLLATGQAARADRIWFSETLVEMTGGYNPSTDETYLNKWYLTTHGPDSLGGTAREVVIDCIKTSAVAGAGAFKASPSPELGTRFAAAYTTFHSSLATCFSLRGVAKSLLGKFEVGLLEAGVWVPGARLEFSATHPNQQLYEQLHKSIGAKVPDPMNKLIKMFIGVTSPNIEVDIHVKMPPWLREQMKRMPPPEALTRFEQEARKRIPRSSLSDLARGDLEAFVKSEVERVAQQYGKEKVEKELPRLLGQAYAKADLAVKAVSIEAERLFREGGKSARIIVRAMAEQLELRGRELARLAAESGRAAAKALAQAGATASQQLKDGAERSLKAAEEARKAASDAANTAATAYKQSFAASQESVKQAWSNAEKASKSVELAVAQQAEAAGRLAGALSGEQASREEKKIVEDLVRKAQGLGIPVNPIGPGSFHLPPGVPTPLPPLPVLTPVFRGGGGAKGNVTVGKVKICSPFGC